MVSLKTIRFASEAALEDFVWVHLEALLGLVPFKRQYSLNGECCDLLAFDQAQRLVVLELKNAEDRYVVQQLTRYYDQLLAQPPLALAVPDSQRLRLLAIAPTFHRHNWIDQRYCRLNIEFLSFALSQDNDRVYFKLQHLGTGASTTIAVPHPQSRPSPFTRRPPTHNAQVAATLHAYVRVRYAYKLGLPEVPPNEVQRQHFQPGAKGSKAFKIVLRATTAKGTARQVTVRVPAKITLRDFYAWVYKNIPTAIGIITPNGCSYRWGSRAVPHDEETACLDEAEGDP